MLYWPRGRVWGGSSALNAMVYVRGHASDYDRWQDEGADGWSYADCLPYFKKSQTHQEGCHFCIQNSCLVMSICVFKFFLSKLSFLFI